MKLYLFEYLEGKAVHPFQVRAANAWDAFDIFRAHKPYAVIAEAWVVPINPAESNIDTPTGLAG